jgi:putative SOS response-associated peptidase YedK
MATRYRLEAGSADIATALSADLGPDPWGGGEVGVGQFAPVITRGGKSGRRVIRPMHWGYPPPGQPSETFGLGPPRWVASVRNLESPYWIGNLRHCELRCLIPATHFENGTGKARRWYCVADEPVFAIAGIWRDLTDMPVFAVLATEPSSALIPVEGKGASASMPLILQRADHDRWLRADWKEAQELVRPLPSAAIVAEADIGG